MKTNTADLAESIASGEKMLEAGDLVGARASFEEALRSSAEDPRVLLNLGRVLEQSGLPDEARNCFMKAQSALPNSQVVQQSLDDLTTELPSSTPPPSTIQWVKLSRKTNTTPAISIVVPTFERPEAARRLVEALKLQTVDPSQFELIMVDDGSKEPIAKALKGLSPDFFAAVGRIENSGPSTARNRAIEVARGALTLILNDDALPSPDLLQAHLETHARQPENAAVLGAFPYSEHALKSPFVRFLDKEQLTFGYGDLKTDQLHDFWSFWTCNISLRTKDLFAVDGFDESFNDAMSEDIELGWRLCRDRQLFVRYQPQALCHHEHRVSVANYLNRQISMGRNAFRLYHKYGNSTLLSLGMNCGQLGYGYLGPIDGGFFKSLEKTLIAPREKLDRAISLFENWDRKFMGRPYEDATNPQLGGVDPKILKAAITSINRSQITRGMVAEAARHGMS